MSGLDVLIVGASIAGPTAAYCFALAGANVTVIERFPELRGGGQNVDIRSVGVTIMRKLGFEAAVRANLAPLDGISLVNDDGSVFATMMSGGNEEQQSLVSEYEIFRGDLSRILYNLTKDDPRVKYVFGEQVVAIEQRDDEPATVTFANGYPTGRYDLVVACDGSTSRTRGIGLNCGVRDFVHPVNAWSAYFTIDKDLLDGRRVGQSFCAAGGRFLAIGADHQPGRNRVGVTGIASRDNDERMVRFREAYKQGNDAMKQFVASTFQGMGWKTQEIMKDMMKSDNFYASELVQVKLPSIYNGRFVLAGDAGYGPGPTGAGTSLAMAGAYILAGEISRHGKDIQAGLKAYQERMQPLLKDMQKIPPGVPGVMAPQTAWGLWFRNQIFRLICHLMAFAGLFSWISGMFASSFAKDTYGIPDYEWLEKKPKSS